MCDVKKMFLFVLKRDKICFGGILDNFCYSVQSVVGWNLGGAFLVVIFPMKSGGHFLGGGGTQKRTNDLYISKNNFALEKTKSSGW